MKTLSLGARLFLKVCENAQFGTVNVEFPDGSKASYGTGSPSIDVKAHDWEVFDLLFKKADSGMAEVIIEGRLVVSDIAALVEWACRNEQVLGKAYQGKWYGLLAGRIRHWLAHNSRRGAKKNIMAHYDLGNEFYRLWLDQSMTYSSAIYKTPNDSLVDAQNAKYDRIIDRLGIQASDHVLEIGCGWGGFFSRAVERTGCKVTAVMNSPEQSRHNSQMIERKGLRGHVDLKEMDYRDIKGKFDKIVSIEMIEAIGEQYWPTYFSKVSSSLKDKGKALIQGITIRDDLFEGYRSSTDFIQQYVFPGGMLLTNDTFEKQSTRNRMTLTENFEFGQSYATTLKAWRGNFDSALAEVRRMGFDDKFVRMWSLYLSYCEGAFRAGRINVGQFLLEK